MTRTTKHGELVGLYADAGKPHETLLDYAAVSKMINVSVGTLRWLVHDRRIPHLRLGPRTIRFERRAIERWIAERRVAEI